MGQGAVNRQLSPVTRQPSTVTYSKTMENDPAMLYCPNQDCLAANPLNHKFCQQCSTALPKRYLWAVGDALSMHGGGELLGDRYLIITGSVVLDTKPGLPPQMPDSLEKIKAYLRLFPYRLNIPQIYGILPLLDNESLKEIFLLEPICKINYCIKKILLRLAIEI